jgi:hypothetical protein
MTLLTLLRRLLTRRRRRRMDVVERIHTPTDPGPGGKQKRPRKH